MGSLLSSDGKGAQDVSTSSNNSVDVSSINLFTSSSKNDSALSSFLGKETIYDSSASNSSLTPSLETQDSNDLQRQSPTSFGNYHNNTLMDPSAPINSTATNPIPDDDFKFNLFGTYVYPFRWLTLPTLYSWLGPLSSLAMIIGCVLPYVPQYLTIYRYRDCSGFSTFVCLTLLIANILRVAFWFGHSFELPLLVQSVIMILAQLLLLELCVRVSDKHIKRSLFRSSPRYFWRWTYLISYIEFLCLFSALLAIAVYFLIDCEPFVETLGYCALVTESMLGLPQVIKNYKNRSVEGMSIGMVLMWLGGDTFKTGYFIINNVPFQFWLCGLSQITIDLLIIFQVCIFRKTISNKKGSNRSSDASPKEMMAL